MKNILLKLKENRWIIRATPFVILIIIDIFFSVATEGRFNNINNIKIIFNQAIITGTVATGAIFIFGTGNVNIALGASTALAATLASLVYFSTNSVAAMIVTAIAVGVLLMIVMTILSTAFNVRVMFVSIVMLVLFSAIQQTIIGAGSLSLPYTMTSALSKSNFSYISLIAYFLVCAVLFHFTGLGRSIRMIGTNPICAQQTGLFPNKYLMQAFIVAGIGVGLGAVMTIIRSGNINNNTASSLNMDVMLAIVLGGMSVFGGSKSFIYAGLIGAVTVTLLNNGLLMVGVSPTILQLVRGLVFLGLVFTGQKRPEGLPSPEV